MMEEFDVIVAGGGPAGSSMANFLRQRGRSVLVLEREQFPRFHIGESLLPFANDIWKELGVFETMDAALHPQARREVHPRRVRRRVHLLLRHRHPSRSALRLPGQARRVRPDAPRARRRAGRRGPRGDHGRRRRLRRRRRGRHARRSRAMASATGAAPHVRRRHRPRRDDRRPARSSRSPTIWSPPTSPLHAIFKGIDREAGADEGNIILGLFDGGWWWRHPVQGRRHLGGHGVREELHQAQSRRSAPRRCSGRRSTSCR